MTDAVPAVPTRRRTATRSRSRQIVEVLPLVDVKQMPRAPRGRSPVLFNYRGAPVPVIDLSRADARAAGARAARARASSLVHYPDAARTARVCSG